MIEAKHIAYIYCVLAVMRSLGLPDFLNTTFMYNSYFDRYIFAYAAP